LWIIGGFPLLPWFDDLGGKFEQNLKGLPYVGGLLILKTVLQSLSQPREDKIPLCFLRGGTPLFLNSVKK
jgi:hypothetical protein